MSNEKDSANSTPSERSKLGTGKAISLSEIAKWHGAYQEHHRALCDEISFALNAAINAGEIRISEISTRIKSLESTAEKFGRKGYSDFSEVSDIVGARVVCLFRQDLFLIKSAIEKTFDVLSFDDKLYDDPNSFGYMSLHFQCRLRQDYTGPRYDALKKTSFELQVRTICMHAWSAVQHALEYKGEWDVPQSLKKDINALSAIFYLADTQFSAVYSAKANGSAQFSSSVLDRRREKKNRDINLDTLIAFAREKFPQRVAADPSDFSQLVKELNLAGYKKIAQIEADVDRSMKALELDEKKEGITYEDVGAIRVSVALNSELYMRELYEGENPFSSDVWEALNANS